MRTEGKVRRQRKYRRFACGGAIDVAWLSPANGICRVTTELLNVSQEGMQVESGIPLPVNTMVQVRGKALKKWAWVRYCHPLGNRFLTGFQVVSGPSDGSVVGVNRSGVHGSDEKPPQYVSH